MTETNTAHGRKPETLYVTDLDGTLLGKDGVLSDASAALLTAAMEAGALVSFATSRSWEAANEALRGFRFNAPCIASGGVVIADHANGVPLRELRLDRESAKTIVRAFLESGAMPFLKCAGINNEDRVYHSILRHPGQKLYTEYRSSQGGTVFCPTERYDMREDEEPVQVFTVDEKSVILRTERGLAELLGHGCKFEFIRFHDPYNGNEWIEGLPLGANKGDAAIFVKAFVGAERIVCFGDGGNDIPLFKVADLAIAVANAAPELLAHADETIGTNEENRVAEFILRHARDSSPLFAPIPD